MRIAIVGAGISGLVAARGLHAGHEITLFESERRLGGHAHTVTVDDAGVERRLDTGFLVFNRRDYPTFDAILHHLEVPTAPSCMSFSVRCDRPAVEYSGSSLDTLFARRGNALRPGFWRMLRDISRFYRSGRDVVDAMPPNATVEDLIAAERYSPEFVAWHLLPLGSALWSAPRSLFRHYPIRFVVDFLDRHDLLELNVRRRVPWRTIAGGSANYVERIAAPFRDRVRLGDGVRAIKRVAAGVRVRTVHGEETFDQVVFACHGDRALELLENPSPEEHAILGAVRYQANEVVLHTDVALLPVRRIAWASWNYHVRPDRDLATVTYDLNRLQSFQSRTRFLVTLNEGHAVDPACVLRRFTYRHPQYSVDWVRRREARECIQGTDRVWYCGAYFGNGFHEDGARSAAEVVRGIASLANGSPLPGIGVREPELSAGAAS